MEIVILCLLVALVAIVFVGLAAFYEEDNGTGTLWCVVATGLGFFFICLATSVYAKSFGTVGSLSLLDIDQYYYVEGSVTTSKGETYVVIRWPDGKTGVFKSKEPAFAGFHELVDTKMGLVLRPATENKKSAN